MGRDGFTQLRSRPPAQQSGPLVRGTFEPLFVSRGYSDFLGPAIDADFLGSAIDAGKDKPRVAPWLTAEQRPSGVTRAHLRTENTPRGLYDAQRLTPCRSNGHAGQPE